MGLFGDINNAVIKNVTIKSASIATDRSNIGFVVGYAEGGVISNCHVDANCKFDVVVDRYVTVSGFAGGIVGSLANKTTMEISGCSFAGSIVAEAYLGGIIGYNGSDTMLTITDCETLAGASLKGNFYIGGIAYLANEVVGCTNNGSVYAAPFACGIIGDHSGSIKNCINNGDVSSVFGAGEIFGVCYTDSATTSNCYSVGDVSGNVYSGAIAGETLDSISSCYFTNQDLSLLLCTRFIGQ